MRFPFIECVDPNDGYYRGVLAARSLVEEDRREIHLLKMILNYRIAITDGPRGLCYQNAYCFDSIEPLNAEAAWHAFHTWDGEGHPPGPWIKNPFTGVYGPGARKVHLGGPERIVSP